ncbi:MAG: DUF4350 domain-containing protein [Spirochaetota bacterium]
MNRVILAAMLLTAILLLLLWFILKPGSRLDFPPYIPGSAHVLYDESHENVWGIWDTGYFGYSTFAGALVGRGVPVSCLSRPLHEVLAHEKTWHFERTILVLSVARFQRYMPDEITAVVNFVENGGLLMVIGEHENMFESSDFHNPLLQKFGLKINDDFVGNTIDPDSIHRKQVSVFNQKSFSSLFGLGNVMHMLAASIDYTGKGEPVVFLEGQREADTVPIAMGVRHGRGAVLVLGDSEMLWNADGIIGIGAGDNMEFILSCVEWLLESTMERVEPSVSTRILKNNDTVIRFAGEMSGTGIDSSPSGLHKFFASLSGYQEIKGDTDEGGQTDVLIVATPLRPLKKEDIIGKRLVLFAESYMVPQKFTVWGRRLISMGADGVHDVYWSLEEEHGVRIEPCFLTDGGLNGSYLDCEVPFFSKRLFLHRAGSLQVEAGRASQNTFVYGTMLPDAIWGETSHPGIVVKNEGKPLYQSSDISAPILVYADENLLVIADSDIIGNQNAGTEGFNAVVKLVSDWIKNGVQGMQKP